MKGVNYRVPRGMPYVRREYIAGKPRLQEGMRRAFGKSTGLAARVHAGQVIFEAHINSQNLKLAKEGFKVASSKLGCPAFTKITMLNERQEQKR